VELLRVPALFFGLAARLRGGLYDRGWLPSARLDVPVVSVGNITVGGTGKTPLVIWLVGELEQRGLRPGVLSRGYGAAPEEKGAGGENDEARMLARLVPDAPRVQNPDRIAGGRRLVELGADVVVLDDGFQHRRLRRDLDLVLIDATRPWGLPAGAPTRPAVRAFLPRGLLREAPEALTRADALVLTRTELVTEREREDLIDELQRIAPGKAVVLAAHRPARLRAPDGAALSLEDLRGREVDLVSAIGNPQAFERTVTALGARVAEHRAFPDHHRYTRTDFTAGERGGRWLVTTAKDAVKLEELDVPAHVLEVQLSIEAGSGVLEALLDALPLGRAPRQRRSLHAGLHG